MKPTILMLAALAAAWPAIAADPVYMAKGAVAGAARDPTSVLFSGVKIEGRCNGTIYVQGWANAKNGYGGYSGSMVFLVRIAHGAAEVMQAYGHVFATDAALAAAAACTGD